MILTTNVTLFYAVNSHRLDGFENSWENFFHTTLCMEQDIFILDY
jgi:hypothetical protein